MIGDEEYVVRVYARDSYCPVGNYRHVPLAHVWDILEGWASHTWRGLRCVVSRETGPLGIRFGAALIDDRGGG
jgi:hypothetical protein